MTTFRQLLVVGSDSFKNEKLKCVGVSFIRLISNKFSVEQKLFFSKLCFTYAVNDVFDSETSFK